MPTQRTISIYKYDELSPRAQDKARDWFRQTSSDDNYFAESVIEHAATVAGFLGLDVRQRSVKLMNGETRQEPAIYWSLGYSQSDGASFDGRWRASDMQFDKLREYAPTDDYLHNIAIALRTVAQQYPESYAQCTYSHRSSVPGVEFDANADRSEETYSASQWKEVRATEESAGADVRDALRAFAQWIYDRLRAEHECRNADEQVAEDIRANEYEFLEDGTRA